MLHRYAICLVTAGALLAGCDTEPTEPEAIIAAEAAPANAMVEHTRERNLDDLLINDCTGEEFPTTIALHELFAITQAPAGSTHIKYHLNIGAVAVDAATGEVYRGIQVVNENLNVGPGETYTAHVKFVMIGRGEGKLVDLAMAIHLTVNPDGTVTSSFDRLSLTGRDCGL